MNSKCLIHSTENKKVNTMEDRTCRLINCNDGPYFKNNTETPNYELINYLRDNFKEVEQRFIDQEQSIQETENIRKINMKVNQWLMDNEKFRINTNNLNTFPTFPVKFNVDILNNKINGISNKNSNYIEKNNCDKVANKLMEQECNNNTNYLKPSSKTTKVEILNNKFDGISNEKSNYIKDNCIKDVHRLMESEKYKLKNSLNDKINVFSNGKINYDRDNLIKDEQGLMERKKYRNNGSAFIRPEENTDAYGPIINKTSIVNKEPIINKEPNVYIRKIYERAYSGPSSAFALSKCFIAPPAKDFPMPPQQWLNDLAESGPTQQVAVKTSAAIQTHTSINMNAMFNMEISTKRVVTSTPKDVNFLVSYNMKMMLNVKNNLLFNEISIIEHA